jgi:hypothetical protein
MSEEDQVTSGKIDLSCFWRQSKRRISCIFYFYQGIAGVSRFLREEGDEEEL